MRQSNLYVIGFAAVLTIVCGGLLALASQGLKPLQKEQIKTDTRKQILSAVMTIEDGMNVNDIYEARIKAYAVDAEGNVLEDVDESQAARAGMVENMKKNYKLADETQKQFPVFEYKNESGKLEAYIVPVFGKGLWDAVWGYVALKPDLNTIKGVSFGHKGETPGLGARITEPAVQSRFKGKEILGDNGELKSVEFIKGEGVKTPSSEHKVDGLSGASMTTKGVNEMLENYFSYYQPYFKKIRN